MPAGTSLAAGEHHAVRHITFREAEHIVQQKSSLVHRTKELFCCLRPTKLYVSLGKTPKKYTGGDATFAVCRLDKLGFIEVSLQFLYLANSPMIQQSCRPQP